MTDSLKDLADGALAELGAVFDKLGDKDATPLVEAMATAKKVVLFGCGREGLQMRGFAMRLFHLGRDVSVWGDMTMPPVGPGDLLLVSAGPGYLATVEALIDVAHKAGAKTALVTAQSSAALAKQVDLVTVIPAQTMADDRGAEGKSVLPMGSLFETAQMIFFELVMLRLRDRLGESAETMRARHTNLE